MAKKKKVTGDPIDTGSDMIHKRYTVVPRLTRGLHGYNMRVMDETEIDKMLLHETIDVDQHSLLEQFLKRLMKAQFSPLRSPDFSSSPKGDATRIADQRALAIRSVTGVFSALDKSITAPHRIALVSLVLEDQKWPFESDALSVALSALAVALAN